MNQTSDVETIIGRLVAGIEKTTIPIPLKKTTIQGEILGPLASIQVSQVFTNPLAEPSEMDYLFPLPENAAIADFELRIGERVITAEIEELDQARRRFEEASQQGKRAGLFEQRRSNLFAIRLTNVLPGETVQTRLRYQGKIKFEDGTFELVFPMGLTPRYHTADHPEEASQTDFPIAEPGLEVGKVEINLVVDAGTEVNDPTSPTHPLKAARIDGRRFQVTLDGEHIPDHDFILRYSMVSSSPTICAWSSHDESGEYLLAAVFPPALAEDFQAPQRDFLFILDRSGSMSGEPIKQARNALRACLRALNEGDTFRILLFDNEIEWLSKSPCAVKQKEIDRADSFLGQVEGRGGTEILKSLEAAFSLPKDEARSRYIVFLTDGAVSAEERALQQIRAKLGKARLFTFGIGPSVNRAFLSQMARLGHGTAEFLQLDEDIEGAIIRFQDRVSFPIWTDLALSWEGVRAWDIYPSALPDLYAGQPLELCCRFQRSQASAALVVSGNQNSRPAKQRFELQAEATNEETIRRVWCRARVDDLLEQMASHPEETARIRNEIISLALQSRLVTPFTAFVAIDQETTGADLSKRKTIHVAQPLPKDLDRSGFESLPYGVPHQGVYMASMPPMAAPRPVMAAPKSKPYFGSLDVPAFLRKKGEHKIDETPATKFDVEMESSAEELLRWLARTQNVDGSWNQDVERTSAALMAFLRHGHTTRAGNYRQAVRRAFGWLESRPVTTGTPAFIRCLALDNLARATTQPAHQAAAQAARSQLPHPDSTLERAILAVLDNKPTPDFKAPSEIKDMNDLKLAAVLGIESLVIPKQMQESGNDILYTWLAIVK